MVGSTLDLLAQPAHVHRHRRLVAERPAPHLLQQLLAGERGAGMRDQELQQVVLPAGQRQHAVTQGRLVAAQVDDQVAVLQPALLGLGALAGPAQHRLDPQHQLAGAERLGHVVVGAQLEADDPVGLGAERGQHDHRDVAAGAQPAADLETVDPGQHQVEDHQVGRVVAHQRGDGLAVAGLVDLVTGRAQVGDHDLAHGRVVIDHQHPGHRTSPQLSARSSARPPGS